MQKKLNQKTLKRISQRVLSLKPMMNWTHGEATSSLTPRKPPVTTMMRSAMMTAKPNSTKIKPPPPPLSTNTLVNSKHSLSTMMKISATPHAKPFSKPNFSNGRKPPMNYAKRMIRQSVADKLKISSRIPSKPEELLTTLVKTQTEKHSMLNVLKPLKPLNQLLLLLGWPTTHQLQWQTVVNAKRRNVMKVSAAVL